MSAMPTPEPAPEPRSRGRLSRAGRPSAEEPLTDRDRRILDLEEQTFRFVGAKEKRIREELGMSPAAYHVRLNALLDRRAALEAHPALVNRLRARRASMHGGHLV